MFPETNTIFANSEFEKLNIEEGFLFSPFKIDNEHPSFALRSKKFSVPIQDLLKLRNVSEKNTEKIIENVDRSTSKTEHCKNVELVLEKINSSALDKVVLARRKCLTGKVNALALFLNAIEKYPGAFVHFIQLPDRGIWLGASPERLLAIKNGRATIDSLAATQKGNAGARIRDWSNKEREEQRIVTKYIDGLLNDLGINDRSWTQPEDHKAGRLLHLISKVSFDLSWGERKTLELLKMLHPTPAVCGSPKAPALELIEKLEDFNREYYTGFLGPIDKNGNVDLFVNLRCMHIQNDRIEVFAGGGITRDSNPEAEWIETEHKCSTMLDLLN